MSIFQDANGQLSLNTVLQLSTTIARMDNYVVIVRGPAGYYVTHALYAVGSTLGWLLGYKPWYEEYTPTRVRAVAASGGRDHLKKMV